MAFNQAKFKATADKLLGKSSMGKVTISRAVTTPAGNEWDTPTVTLQTETVDAVAFGVASKYVDGQSILVTDIMVTMTVPSQYQVGDIINIDGSPTTIIHEIRMPAAGDPTYLQFIVRG